MALLIRKIFISAHDAKVGRLSVIGFTGIAHHYLQIVSLAPLSGVEPPKEISAAGVAGPKAGVGIHLLSLHTSTFEVIINVKNRTRSLRLSYPHMGAFLVVWAPASRRRAPSVRAPFRRFPPSRTWRNPATRGGCARPTARTGTTGNRSRTPSPPHPPTPAPAPRSPRRRPSDNARGGT